jgi:hypothetical protein
MPKTTRPTGAGKRYPLNMRTTRETREKLEASASANGRSLAQEVEARLEQAFEQDQRLEDVFGSADLFGLLRAVGTAMDAAGKSAAFMSTRSPEGARGWIDHPYAYDQALQAAVQVLQALRPHGKIEPPDVRPPTLPAGYAPQPPGVLDMTTGRVMTEEEANERRQAHMQRLGRDHADALLGQIKSLPEQAATMRANLGRLADRLDKEQDQ